LYAVQDVSDTGRKELVTTLFANLFKNMTEKEYGSDYKEE
jgi:hypothetical protein